MKWITHQTVAVGSAVALGFPPPLVVAVFVGSVLPDVIDMTLARLTPCPEQTFKRIHRGFSHWYGSYLLAFVLCFAAVQGMDFFEKWNVFSSKASYFQWGVGLSFGALMHILLDMCTPSGVPLLPFVDKSRFSLRLFPTGSVQEYAFLALAVICFASYASFLEPSAWRELQGLGQHVWHELGDAVRSLGRKIF